MSSEAFTLDVTKHIATITFCQPKKLNALNSDAYYALAATMRKIAEMPEVTVTVITGMGRYFSAGADVQSTGSRTPSEGLDERRFWYQQFAANNIDVTRTFMHHPKILVVAMNGPAVGLSAALCAFADFIYAADNSFLLTPFSSLGLVAEGGASAMFVTRMGIAKANEALILSRRISASELHACGFVNQLFPAKDFAQTVRAHIEDTFGNHINHDSMMGIKKLIRQSMEEKLEAANVREAAAGVLRFAAGIPQAEFGRIARGEKKHKL